MSPAPIKVDKSVNETPRPPLAIVGTQGWRELCAERTRRRRRAIILRALGFAIIVALLLFWLWCARDVYQVEVSSWL